MKLTREQVRTGILECLNQYCSLQENNVQISDETNIYAKVGLDYLDCEIIAGDINVLFDICMHQEDAHEFLNMQFGQTVDFIYNLNPTLGTTGRTPVLAGLSMGQPEMINDPYSMNHIDAVLYGKIKPAYTLYPKSPDTTNWAEICATIREEQQERESRERQKKQESERQEYLVGHEYLEKERKKTRRGNIIIVTLILSAMAGVALARHYVIKNRKKDTKSAVKQFEQEQQKMTKFIQFPIQKVK